MKLDVHFPRPMTFRRVGRAYQLQIASADDLEHVLDLDEAHWVAVSAPLTSFHYDERFLVWVDADKDGRIRPFELRRCITWTLAHLADRAGLSEGRDTLSAATVAPGGPDSALILASIARQLQHLGREADAELSLADVRRLQAHEEARAVSASGVVLPSATELEGLRSCLVSAVAVTGGTLHPSGGAGVTEAQLDRFFIGAREYLDWVRRGAADGPGSEQLFGAATSALYTDLEAARDKIDEYFAQCRLVAVDPEVAIKLGAVAGRMSDDEATDPAALKARLEAAPLAPPDPGMRLPFGAALNPGWRARIEALRVGLVARVLGPGPRTHLTEAEWATITAAMADHCAWEREFRWPAYAALGAERLAADAVDAHVQASKELLASGRNTSLNLDAIRSVEQLLMGQAFLLRLVNNYVSFPDLYRGKRRALFDRGDLTMDGRHFKLAVHVEDRGEHARVCKGSYICVLYLEVTGEEVEPYEVAVAVTSGGRGNLSVGKRGVFEDEDDRQLDARVVQIIENPISIFEAILAPFKRLWSIVTAKIEGLTDDTDERLHKAADGALARVAAEPPKPAQVQTMVQGGAGSLMAGWGIAIAALGSSMAFITSTLGSLDWVTIGTGLLGVVAAVVLPAALVAWLRLRQRDLSALLEGSGWAINARMRITLRQALFFTVRPPYPLYARGLHRRWAFWILLLGGLAIAATTAWLAVEQAWFADGALDVKLPSLDVPVEAPKAVEPRQ